MWLGVIRSWMRLHLSSMALMPFISQKPLIDLSKTPSEILSIRVLVSTSLCLRGCPNLPLRGVHYDSPNPQALPFRNRLSNFGNVVLEKHFSSCRYAVENGFVLINHDMLRDMRRERKKRLLISFCPWLKFRLWFLVEFSLGEVLALLLCAKLNKKTCDQNKTRQLFK